MVPFPDSILVKTPRGRAELASRTGRMSALARRVLILVDGRRTVAELAELLAQPLSAPHFCDALVTLERERYVDRLEEIQSVA